MTARLRLTLVAAMATVLAALGLSSVFNDGAWIWPVVFSVAVASGGCALGRRFGAARPVVPLVGLAGVMLFVTSLYARDVAVLGFIPGPGAVRELHRLLLVGIDDVHRFATPAPTDQALVMLAAAGIGAAAVAVDTLAVTCRSAALAGVPLLTLYAVPAGVVPAGVPWVLFVAAALGWLALMLSEGRERLSGWGRALGRRSARGDGVFTAAPAEPLGVVGRRIGAAALGLAVVFPAFVPIVGGGLFSGNGSGGSGGKGTGNSSVTTINPLVGIASDLTARSDTQVLTYTSSDANPDYLRMITLDGFDGTNWAVSKLTAAGNAEDLDASKSDPLPGPVVTTQISVTGLRTSWLPLPYPTQGIANLGGDWVYDAATLDVFARGNDTTVGRDYDVTSRHPQLDADQLRAATAPPVDLATHYTALPRSIPAPVRTATGNLIRGLTNDYDKALAIQQFFLDPKNGFTYTTDIPQFKGSPLVAFLNNRKGFCQQYATMYAVMARLAGLPTRINVGFTQGFQQTPGTWVVSRQNAHAWPEVYFGGIGWVRFEPTPGPSGVQNPTYALRPQGSGSTGLGSTAPLIASRSEHNGQRDQLDPGDDGTSAKKKAATALAAPKEHWVAILGTVAALLLLVSPSVTRIARRRRRLRPGRRADLTPARRVLDAWRELADTGRDLGLPWASSRTPRRTAEALVAYGVKGESAAAVRRLARAVERVRYAPSDVDVLGGQDPGTDARLVVAAMESASAGRVRWRARLFPASVLAVAAGHFADTLDWVDGLGARVRNVLGRLLPGSLAGRQT
jgi:hypothetical protein